MMYSILAASAEVDYRRGSPPQEFEMAPSSRISSPMLSGINDQLKALEILSEDSSEFLHATQEISSLAYDDSGADWVLRILEALPLSPKRRILERVCHVLAHPSSNPAEMFAAFSSSMRSGQNGHSVASLQEFDDESIDAMFSSNLETDSGEIILSILLRTQHCTRREVLLPLLYAVWSLLARSSPQVKKHVASEELVWDILLRGMQSDDVKENEYTAGILWSLSTASQARAILARQGGITAALPRMIASSSAACRARVVGAVWALASDPIARLQILSLEKGNSGTASLQLDTGLKGLKLDTTFAKKPSPTSSLLDSDSFSSPGSCNGQEWPHLADGAVAMDHSDAVSVRSVEINSSSVGYKGIHGCESLTERSVIVQVLLLLQQTRERIMASAALFKLGVPSAIDDPKAGLFIAEPRKGQETYVRHPPPREVSWAVGGDLLLPEPGRGSVLFFAEGTDNIRVVLSVWDGDSRSNDTSASTHLYQLVIRGHNGKGGLDSTIRRVNGQNRTESKLLARKTEESVPDTACEQFWFSVDSVSGVLCAGKGKLGEGIFLWAVDRSAPLLVQRVGFSNWNSAVSYCGIEVGWPVSRSNSGWPITALPPGPWSWISNVVAPTALQVSCAEHVPGSQTSIVSGQGVLLGGGITVLPDENQEDPEPVSGSQWMIDVQRLGSGAMLSCPCKRHVLAASELFSSYPPSVFPKLVLGDGSVQPAVLLHSDVHRGPGGATPQLDLASFVNTALSYIPTAILCVGWTTSDAVSKTSRRTPVGAYTESMISGMLQAAKEYPQVAFCFTVEAQLVRGSWPQVKRLFQGPAHWSLLLRTALPLSAEDEDWLYKNLDWRRTFFDFRQPRVSLLQEVAKEQEEKLSSCVGNPQVVTRSILSKAICAHSKDFNLLASYAKFLLEDCGLEDQGEYWARKALETSPAQHEVIGDLLLAASRQTSNPRLLQSYGAYLAKYCKDWAASERYNLVALSHDPKNLAAMCSIASGRMMNVIPRTTANEYEEGLLNNGAKCLARAVPTLCNEVKEKLACLLEDAFTPRTRFSEHRPCLCSPDNKSCDGLRFLWSTLHAVLDQTQRDNEAEAATQIDANLYSSSARSLGVAALAKMAKQASLLCPGVPIDTGLPSLPVASDPDPFSRGRPLSLRDLQEEASNHYAEWRRVETEFEKQSQRMREKLPRLFTLASSIAQDVRAPQKAPANSPEFRFQHRVHSMLVENVVDCLAARPWSIALLLVTNGYLRTSNGCFPDESSTSTVTRLARSVLMGLCSYPDGYGWETLCFESLKHIMIGEFNRDSLDFSLALNRKSGGPGLSAMFLQVFMSAPPMLRFLSDKMQGCWLRCLDLARFEHFSVSGLVVHLRPLADDILCALRMNVDSIPFGLLAVISTISRMQGLDSEKAKLQIYQVIYTWLSNMSCPDVLSRSMLGVITPQVRQNLKTVWDLLDLHLWETLLESSFLKKLQARALSAVPVDLSGIGRVKQFSGGNSGVGLRNFGIRCFFAEDLRLIFDMACKFVEVYSSKEARSILHMSHSAIQESQVEELGRMLQSICFSSMQADETLPKVLRDSSRARELVIVQTSLEAPERQKLEFDQLMNSIFSVFIDPSNLTQFGPGSWSDNNEQMCMTDHDLLDYLAHVHHETSGMHSEAAFRSSRSSVQVGCAIEQLEKFLHSKPEADNAILPELSKKITTFGARCIWLKQLMPVLVRLERRADIEIQWLCEVEETFRYSQAVQNSRWVQAAVAGCKRDLRTRIERSYTDCTCEFDIVDTSLSLCDDCKKSLQLITNHLNWKEIGSILPRAHFVQLLAFELGDALHPPSEQDELMRSHMRELGTVLPYRIEIPSRYQQFSAWSMAAKELGGLKQARLLGDKCQGLNRFASILRESMAKPDPDVLLDLCAVNVCIGAGDALLPTIRSSYFCYLIENDAMNSPDNLSAFLEKQGIVNIFLALAYVRSLDITPTDSPEEDAKMAATNALSFNGPNHQVISFAIRHVPPDRVLKFVDEFLTLSEYSVRLDEKSLCSMLLLVEDGTIVIDIINRNLAEYDVEKLLWMLERFSSFRHHFLGLDACIVYIIKEIRQKASEDAALVHAITSSGMIEAVCRLLFSVHCNQRGIVNTDIRDWCWAILAQVAQLPDAGDLRHLSVIRSASFVQLFASTNTPVSELGQTIAHPMSSSTYLSPDCLERIASILQDCHSSRDQEKCNALNKLGEVYSRHHLVAKGSMVAVSNEEAGTSLFFVESVEPEAMCILSADCDLTCGTAVELNLCRESASKTLFERLQGETGIGMDISSSGVCLMLTARDDTDAPSDPSEKCPDNYSSGPVIELCEASMQEIGLQDGDLVLVLGAGLESLGYLMICTIQLSTDIGDGQANLRSVPRVIERALSGGPIRICPLDRDVSNFKIATKVSLRPIVGGMTTKSWNRSFDRDWVLREVLLPHFHKPSVLRPSEGSKLRLLADCCHVMKTAAPVVPTFLSSLITAISPQQRVSLNAYSALTRLLRVSCVPFSTHSNDWKGVRKLLAGLDEQRYRKLKMENESILCRVVLNQNVKLRSAWAPVDLCDSTLGVGEGLSLFHPSEHSQSSILDLAIDSDSSIAPPKNPESWSCLGEFYSLFSQSHPKAMTSLLRETQHHEELQIRRCIRSQSLPEMPTEEAEWSASPSSPRKSLGSRSLNGRAKLENLGGQTRALSPGTTDWKRNQAFSQSATEHSPSARILQFSDEQQSTRTTPVKAMGSGPASVTSGVTNASNASGPAGSSVIHGAWLYTAGTLTAADIEAIRVSVPNWGREGGVEVSEAADSELRCLAAFCHEYDIQFTIDKW